jgi:histidine ammonia-lyase
MERRRNGGDVIYGVTTGVGDSCVRPVPAALADEFSRQLTRMHGCGLGRFFEPDAVAAILVTQINSLTKGYSAVRFEVLDRLRLMFNHRLLPLIPEEGSVGASGDLTPLSYIAAVVMGERRVLFRGGEMDAAEALAALQWAPLKLRPKEGLALINGTSVMTGVACLAFDRARYLLELSTRLAALLSAVLLGNKGHFDPRLFEAKPHPGQREIAARLAEDLQWTPHYARDLQDRIQDTYALRCTPHVLGVLNDALPWMRQFLETELNGVHDNPLIDPETGDVMHGGNFYGGHVAFAMDALKNAVANVADLLDRQMALLVNEKRNRGLPLNLSGATPDRLPVNHGFKAVQIACSAWAAEALKNTMPASVFSRSTESHNQDKVSMGTIAARDGMRVIELTEQVLAAVMLGAAQAWDLRSHQPNPPPNASHPQLAAFVQQIRQLSAFVTEDRPLDGDLRAVLNAIRGQTIQCAW